MKKSKALPKKSSLPPGKQLEHDFAVWMRAKLKYNTTETGKHLTPNSGGATYEFDVYATRRDPRSIRFARIGAAIYFLACAIYFFQWNEAEEVLTDAVTLIEPALAGSALALFGIVGFALTLYNIKKLETKAFVECKDLKGKVGGPSSARLPAGCRSSAIPKNAKRGEKPGWSFPAPGSPGTPWKLPPCMASNAMKAKSVHSSASRVRTLPVIRPCIEDHE